jgi:hypothetical protein
VSADDWRLMGQESYLTGITLARLPYRAPSESWAHDHCEFCQAKFMPAGVESAETEHAAKPVQHEGYTNVGFESQKDHYWWICDDYFPDFKDRFGWTISED